MSFKKISLSLGKKPKMEKNEKKTHLLFSRAAPLEPPFPFPLLLLLGTLQKSTARSTALCPPPRCLTVTCPVAFRPPDLPPPLTSCLCGDPFHSCCLEVMTRPRMPGVVGL